jgi:hypothetical protein
MLRLYLMTSFVYSCIGGVMALIIRASCPLPERPLVRQSQPRPPGENGRSLVQSALTGLSPKRFFRPDALGGCWPPGCCC